MRACAGCSQKYCARTRAFTPRTHSHRARTRASYGVLIFYALARVRAQVTASVTKITALVRVRAHGSAKSTTLVRVRALGVTKSTALVRVRAL